MMGTNLNKMHHENIKVDARPCFLAACSTPIENLSLWPGVIRAQGAHVPSAWKPV